MRPSDTSPKGAEELMVSPLLQESAIGEREARRQSGNDDRRITCASYLIKIPSASSVFLCVKRLHVFIVYPVSLKRLVNISIA